MTVREAQTLGSSLLRHAAIESADLDTDVLLTAVLKATREVLYAHAERRLTAAQERRFRLLLDRRKRREPIAYILGEKEFWMRPFFVTRDTLIPRPETELLVEEALRHLPMDRSATVADVGTGSGCVGITLIRERPHVRVLATDISERALSMARKNAHALRAASRITFLHGNLLEPLRGHHVDLIVANLPYVPAEEVTQNPDLAYEPLIALRGQMTPERTFGLFLHQWYEREDRPVAILEIHPQQTPIFLKESSRIGVSVAVKKDLAGRERIVVLSYQPLR